MFGGINKKLSDSVQGDLNSEHAKLLGKIHTIMHTLTFFELYRFAILCFPRDKELHHTSNILIIVSAPKTTGRRLISLGWRKVQANEQRLYIRCDSPMKWIALSSWGFLGIKGKSNWKRIKQAYQRQLTFNT